MLRHYNSLLSEQDICYPFTCMTITVRIACVCHAFVFVVIVQESCELLIDSRFIRADQLQITGFDTFRSFRLVSQHQNRFAKSSCFFLDAATVSEDDVTVRRISFSDP